MSLSPAVAEILEDYAREICTTKETANHLVIVHTECLADSSMEAAVYFGRIKPEYRDSFEIRKSYDENEDLLIVPIPPLVLAMRDLSL